MQIFEAFLNKKWQTVMWHRECGQSIHVQQPCGLSLGEKSLGLGKAKTFLSRPRPRSEVPSSRPRPGLEDNKTGTVSTTGGCTLWHQRCIRVVSAVATSYPCFFLQSYR